MLENHLKAIDVPENTINKIVKDKNVLKDFCVQPGTKGAIRGYEFNMIVKKRLEQITKFIPNNSDFVLVFEQKINNLTKEIPDWYIQQRSTKKMIIGMNQIDLWSGGQQTNRGSKYILNENYHNNNDVKFLSVVCKHIQVDNENSKVYTLLLKGLQCGRITYLNGLKDTIYDYFGI